MVRVCLCLWYKREREREIDWSMRATAVRRVDGMDGWMDGQEDEAATRASE